jgi:hypothetical protein
MTLIVTGSSKTGTSTFNVNPSIAPTVGTLIVMANLTPQREWSQITVPITDPNTMAVIKQVSITLFYDSDNSHPIVPTSANVQTCAILTWTRTSGWTINPSNGTTWTINTAGCGEPSDILTSGNWVFSFQIGKVATNSTANSGWDIYAQATDSYNTTGNNRTNGITMAWYGEVSVSTLTVNFGIVAPGSDFTNNVQTNIMVTYICNGIFHEQVMTTSPWLSDANSDTLNASGSPGAGEFSLKANTTSDNGSAQLVNSTNGTTIGTGTQTGESGTTFSTNSLWLKVGSGTLPNQYSGTIFYRITP